MISFRARGGKRVDHYISPLYNIIYIKVKMYVFLIPLKVNYHGHHITRSVKLKISMQYNRTEHHVIMSNTACIGLKFKTIHKKLLKYTQSLQSNNKE